MSAVLNQPASSFTPMETGRATVTVYLTARPAWPRTRAALRRELMRVDAPPHRLVRTPIRLSRLRREDWAESWKRHFKPLSFGDKLLVKPSWSRRPARPGQRVVVLDPGLSFGTGQHPTTRFCLEQLVACRRSNTSQALLDLGTGSGILALAAVRLGYSPVEALELDAEALRVARANARLNRVAGRIRFRAGDVAGLSLRPRQRYELICANLTADLLVKHRYRLVRRLAPGGLLVLAGILGKEFQLVKGAYRAAGLKLVASRAEAEWRSGSFA